MSEVCGALEKCRHKCTLFLACRLSFTPDLIPLMPIIAFGVSPPKFRVQELLHWANSLEFRSTTAVQKGGGLTWNLLHDGSSVGILPSRHNRYFRNIFDKWETHCLLIKATSSPSPHMFYETCLLRWLRPSKRPPSLLRPYCPVSILPARVQPQQDTRELLHIRDQWHPGLAPDLSWRQLLHCRGLAASIFYKL